MTIAYTQFTAHLYMKGASVIMDSLLGEQRSVIKFMVAEGEKPCHIFQRLKKISDICVRPRTGRSAEAVRR